MKNVTKPDKLPQNFSIYGNIQYTGKYNQSLHININDFKFQKEN